MFGDLVECKCTGLLVVNLGRVDGRTIAHIRVEMVLACHVELSLFLLKHTAANASEAEDFDILLKHLDVVRKSLQIVFIGLLPDFHGCVCVLKLRN